MELTLYDVDTQLITLALILAPRPKTRTYCIAHLNQSSRLSVVSDRTTTTNQLFLATAWLTILIYQLLHRAIGRILNFSQLSGSRLLNWLRIYRNGSRGGHFDERFLEIKRLVLTR